MTSATARQISLTGYFGLIVVLIAWHGVFQPAYITLVILLVPLAFPFHGLLKGKAYTFAWMSFLTLFYFIHGTVEAYANDNARPFALLEVFASILIYVGVIMYPRLKNREQANSKTI